MAKLDQMKVEKKKDNKLTTGITIAIGLIVVVLAGLSFWYISQQNNTSNPSTGNVVPSDPASLKGLDKFAYCLTQNNIAMYGAYWCPHCANQKARFGSAFKYVHYVECSPNGQNAPQARICTDKGVENYPTWIKDGSDVRPGELELAQLADWSGCTLESGK